MKRHILDGSEKVMRSQIHFFSDIQKTDVTIAGSTTETLLSYFPLDKNDTVQFAYSASNSQYIDVKHAVLYAVVKVVKADGTNLDAASEVSCVNNLAHALFKNVEVSLNSNVVYSSNDLYAYRSFIQTHLGSTAALKDSALSSSLYYKDTGGGVDFDSNAGLRKRKEFVSSSKPIELSCTPCIDLCQQSRYVPPGTSILIRLKRNSDEFCLIAKKAAAAAAAAGTDTTTATTSVTAPCPYRIILQDCCLRLTTHTLNDPFHGQIETALASSKIGRMPMKQTEVKVHFISPDVYGTIVPGLFQGKLPELLVLGILPAESFNGGLHSNPFTFNNCGVSSITVTTDTGAQGVVSQQLSIDKAENLFLECYRSLGLLLTPELSCGISREEYLHGNCFYAFALAPRSLQSTVQPVQHGTVKIAVNFKNKVSEPLVLVAYSQTDAVLTFDSDKNFKFV